MPSSSRFSLTMPKRGIEDRTPFQPDKVFGRDNFIRRLGAMRSTTAICPACSRTAMGAGLHGVRGPAPTPTEADK